MSYGGDSHKDRESVFPSRFTPLSTDNGMDHLTDPMSSFSLDNARQLLDNHHLAKCWGRARGSWHKKLDEMISRVNSSLEFAIWLTVFATTVDLKLFLTYICSLSLSLTHVHAHAHNTSTHIFAYVYVYHLFNHHTISSLLFLLVCHNYHKIVKKFLWTFAEYVKTTQSFILVFLSSSLNAPPAPARHLLCLRILSPLYFL